MTYKKEQLLEDGDLDELMSILESGKTRFAHQDYNLFNVEKTIVKSEHWNCRALQNIRKGAPDMALASHYFLKYGEGSFTRVHTDNYEIVTKTIITFLSSDGLVGGDTLVFDKYMQRSRRSTHYAKRGDKRAPVGKDIIPVTVRAMDGESLIYNASVSHGVTQVESGTRLVLVSWFKNVD